MNDKFYSELITEQLYSNIIAIKEAKDIIDCLLRKVGQFTFVFVNSKKHTCKYIEEKELETTIVERDNFTNIIVFINTHVYRSGYWNHNITFIGIFDIKGNQSTIKFDSFELNSITTGCIGYGYDAEEITSCNITIFENPFQNYLRKVLKPVRKAITSSLNNKWECDSFDLEEDVFSVNIIIKESFRIPTSFNDFLNYLNDFNENYYDNLGRLSKFNPEKYT